MRRVVGGRDMPFQLQREEIRRQRARKKMREEENAKGEKLSGNRRRRWRTECFTFYARGLYGSRGVCARRLIRVFLVRFLLFFSLFLPGGYRFGSAAWRGGVRARATESILGMRALHWVSPGGITGAVPPHPPPPRVSAPD